MNRTMLLMATVALIAIASPLQAQTFPSHRHAPAQTVGHIQHGAIQHGAIQSSKGAACGCAPAAVHGCATCKPCCPPIIPCILNKFDRLLHCLLPSCRFGCGGCSSCGGGKYGGGMIVGEGVILESNVVPQAAQPVTPKQTYYQRRGTLQPRFQATGGRVVRPTPVRRTAAPQPARKPVAKPPTRTASTELKKIDEQRVELQPAPKAASNVRVASFEQQPPKKSRVKNPLR